MIRLPFARLSKELTLFDVYVISTGAMISTGFFLLPGLATASTGPSVVFAYLLAGLLIIPALLSQAELSTAMPRAGGAYYFLDRTLGPLVGTVGGVGTWFALVLKSAFGLIGMGAYLGLVLDVPIVPTAIGVTVLLAALNVAGSKESSGLLRVLVTTLLIILFVFILSGAVHLTQADATSPWRGPEPFMPGGIDGLLATVGLVFVSFGGLAKVASLAEEVKHPDRNIPLGMGLALGTVTVVYVAGVAIMVAALGTQTLSSSLTPVAAAAGAIFSWMPGRSGTWLTVTAAVTAFAAMANAGIMSASRYPLAMARDRLFPDGLAATGRRGTPVRSILLTCTLLVGALLILDVESVAKLASALLLLLFGLLNVAVIVMRESGIDSYDPAFRSPFYPWAQFIGVFAPLVLMAEMGWLPVLFTVGVTGASVGWYTYYARDRIGRDGAIFHVFERLGRRRFAGLDRELRDIMKEKGLRAEDPFDEVVAQAFVLDLPDPIGLDEAIHDASELLAQRVPVDAEALIEEFSSGIGHGGTAVAHGVALLHARPPNVEGSEMVLVRCNRGVVLDVGEEDFAREAGSARIRAVFFLVSGERDPGRHLRILAQLAGRVEDEQFMDEWLADRNEQELKETLLRDERFLSLTVATGTPTEQLVGLALRDLPMPDGSLVALIRRRGRQIVPRGRTVLQEGDRLTIIGDAVGLAQLMERYGDGAG